MKILEHLEKFLENLKKFLENLINSDLILNILNKKYKNISKHPNGDSLSAPSTTMALGRHVPLPLWTVRAWDIWGALHAAGVCDQHVFAARAAHDNPDVDARGGGGAWRAAGRLAAAVADAEIPLQPGGRVLPVAARVAQLLPLLRLLRQLPSLPPRVLLLRAWAMSAALAVSVTAIA